MSDTSAPIYDYNSRAPSPDERTRPTPATPELADTFIAYPQLGVRSLGNIEERQVWRDRAR